MDYTLAKKLKDAGFKQDGVNLDHCGEPVEVYESTQTYEETKCYVPTLEELIEACGEDFMLTNECGKWEAWSNYGGISKSVRMGELGARFQCEGKTPSEAVANLWLALQK